MNHTIDRTSDPEKLREIAREIRALVVRSLAAAGSGHLGGSLGLADVFTCLYFNRMNHRPDQPGWADRDRLILSIGHVAPVLYATLARAGYFPEEETLTLRKLDSRLQGHPARDKGLPGIEISSGSLGQGLSVAVGLALSARIDKKTWRVYCVNGDGELQEGSIWEAAMSAAHHKLANLVMIVDRNAVQIDGATEEVMAMEPLREKFEAFGWNVLECNGNSVEDLIETLDLAEDNPKERPTVILAATRMGFGVAEIQGDYRWHGRVPAPDQVEFFIRQIHE